MSTDVPPRRPSTPPVTTPSSTSSDRRGTTATAEGARKYTVREGDTYWGIAKSVYGAGSLWTAISEANPQVTSLKPGIELSIPPAPPREPAGASTASAAKPARAGSEEADSPRTYKVQKGDTPMGLAKKFYGDAGKYTVLYEANPELRYRELLAGEEIRIPAN